MLRALLWLLVFLTALMAAELRPAPGERIIPDCQQPTFSGCGWNLIYFEKRIQRPKVSTSQSLGFPVNPSKPGVEMCMRMAPRWSQR